uniref:Transcriptional regulator GntR family protein n=1 Tax=uncultured Verrucomicrobiota bacterium TaxID=156588 RepID=D2DXU3_9BACT|nr:transcriptional regulator GntR family protein [uncultured Verrucomicrobiota bacterium]
MRLACQGDPRRLKGTDFAATVQAVSAPLTYHHQIMARLRSLVGGRRFAPGSKFLSEREVAERFKTSRPTANKALSGLVSEGLLEFRKGVGTFVRESALDYDLRRLVSFTEQAKARGMMPGTLVLAFRRLLARDLPPEAGQALEVGGREPVFYMERVRVADRIPVIHERRYVVAAHCSSMTKADVKGSLYALWTGKFGLQLSGADACIRAVNADEVHAANLDIPRGTACLCVVATGFLKGQVPLWWEETVYRSESYEFRNQLGGVNSARPAQGKIR